MLHYHRKPIRRTADSRLTRIATPYEWRVGGWGWRIGFGASGFLVAEGSGASQEIGKRLFRQLEDEWRHRPKKRMPIRK